MSRNRGAKRPRVTVGSGDEREEERGRRQLTTEDHCHDEEDGVDRERLREKTGRYFEKGRRKKKRRTIVGEEDVIVSAHGGDEGKGTEREKEGDWETSRTGTVWQGATGIRGGDEVGPQGEGKTDRMSRWREQEPRRPRPRLRIILPNIAANAAKPRVRIALGPNPIEGGVTPGAAVAEAAGSGTSPPLYPAPVAGPENSPALSWETMPSRNAAGGGESHLDGWDSTSSNSESSSGRESETRGSGGPDLKSDVSESEDSGSEDSGSGPDDDDDVLKAWAEKMFLSRRTGASLSTANSQSRDGEKMGGHCEQEEKGVRLSSAADEANPMDADVEIPRPIPPLRRPSPSPIHARPPSPTATRPLHTSSRPPPKSLVEMKRRRMSKHQPPSGCGAVQRGNNEDRHSRRARVFPPRPIMRIPSPSVKKRRRIIEQQHLFSDSSSDDDEDEDDDSIISDRYDEEGDNADYSSCSSSSLSDDNDDDDEDEYDDDGDVLNDGPEDMFTTTFAAPGNERGGKKRTDDPGRALTPAEIHAILGEDYAGVGGRGGAWVRRSVRDPTRYRTDTKQVRDLVRRLEEDDEDMVVLKTKRYLADPDAPPAVLDEVLKGLGRNTNCQALYIQVSVFPFFSKGHMWGENGFWDGALRQT